MHNPEKWSDLKKILQEKRIKYGPGTKKNPIDINDINVSNITNMSMLFTGRTQFSYIDISNWDVSNVTDMKNMFNGCTLLMSVGDISQWDISNVTNMSNMFQHCNVDIIPEWYDIRTHDRITDNNMYIEDLTI